MYNGGAIPAALPQDKTVSEADELSSSHYGSESVQSSADEIKPASTQRKEVPSPSSGNNTVKSRDFQFKCTLCQHAVFRYYNSFYSHLTTKHNKERQMPGGNEVKKFYIKIHIPAPPSIQLPHNAILKKVKEKHHNTMLLTCPTCKYVTVFESRFTAHCTSKHPWNKRGKEMHAEAIKTSVSVTSDKARILLDNLWRMKMYGYRKQAGRMLKTYHDVSTPPHPPQDVMDSLNAKRSFSCIICLSRFSDVHDLNWHYKSKHSSSTPRVNKQTRLFHCRICINFKSRSAKGIAAHYVELHTQGAYYTWGYPTIQSQLRKVQTMKSKKKSLEMTSIARLQQYDAMEGTAPDDTELVDKKMSDIFHDTCPRSTIQWLPSAAEAHVSAVPLTCHLCSYFTKNIIELLTHCKLSHNDKYPVGTKQMLAKEIEVLVKRFKYKKCETHLFTKPSGAWVDNDDNLVQNVVFYCKKCDLKFDMLNLVYQHFNLIHSDKFTMLDFYVKNLSSPNEEVTTKDPSSEKQLPVHLLSCEHCEFTCNKKSGMHSHYQEEHKDQRYDIRKIQQVNLSQLIMYKCNRCAFEAFHVEMKTHIETEHREFPLNDIKLLSSYFCTNTLAIRGISCKDCSFHTVFKRSLLSHYDNEHRHQAITFLQDEDEVVTCILCKENVQSAELQSHHSKHWEEYNKLQSAANEDALVTGFACRLCSRAYTNLGMLWQHLTFVHKPLSDFISVEKFLNRNEVDVLPTASPSPQIEQASEPPSPMETDEVIVTSPKEALPDKQSPTPPKVSKTTKQDPKTTTTTPRKSPSQSPVSKSPSSSRPSTPTKVKRNYENSRDSSGHNIAPTKYVVSELSPHLYELSNHSKFVCYQCSLCSSLLRTKVEAKQHLDLIERDSVDKHNQLSCTFSSLVVCKFCMFISSHIHNFIRHLSRHFKSYTFDCMMCEERFTSVNSCLEHHINQHGLKISTQVIFNILPSTIAYNSNKETICCWCSCVSESPVMKNRGEISKHFYNFHTQKPTDTQPKVTQNDRVIKKFVFDNNCSYDEDVDDTWSKSVHMKMEHFIERPPVCTLCNRAFICASKFINHLISNHGVKISKCKKSYVKLPQDKSLVEKIAEELLLKQKMDDTAITTNGDNTQPKWQCKTCGEYHPSVSQLHDHLAKAHDLHELYLCCKCEFASLSIESMDSHCSLIHKKPLRQSNSAQDLGVLAQISGPSEQESSNEATPVVPADAIKPKQPSRRLIGPCGAPRPSEEMMARKTIKRSAKSLVDRWVTISGISKCLSCDFSCGDQSRMQSHVATNHRKKTQYRCQFCDYCSVAFEDMDQHIQNFHKIKKNSHIALKIDHDVNNVSSKPINWKEIIEARKAFVYSPVPSIPIVSSRLSRQSSTASSSSSTSKRNGEEEIASMDSNRNGDSASQPPTKRNRFQCMYCGKTEISTHSLERHLQRHESDYPMTQGYDDIGYAMAKIGVIRKVTQ